MRSDSRTDLCSHSAQIQISVTTLPVPTRGNSPGPLAQGKGEGVERKRKRKTETEGGSLLLASRFNSNTHKIGRPDLTLRSLDSVPNPNLNG